MKDKKLLFRAVNFCKGNRESTLICFVFALCLVCGVADRFWLHRSDEFLGALIFEIIIFLIPLFVYLSLSSKKLSVEDTAREMNVRKISPRLIFLPVIATFLLISGTLLLDMLFFGIYDITEGFTLYGQFTANGDNGAVSIVYMILTFAALPAIFEEIIFRKLLIRAYAKKGLLAAVIISGLFYAMTPFSIRLIPSFFFTGVIYCALFLITGSLVTSICAHFLFNIYGLFLRTNIANYFVSSSDAYVLVIITIIVFLISLILFLGIISKLFIAYAKAKKTPPIKDISTSQKIKSAFGVFKSPVNIVCAAIYMTYVLVFAFFG